MQTSVHEYDAKIDSKRRLTLRETNYQYYHVQEMNDGVIMLFPRVLTAPVYQANSPQMNQEKSAEADNRPNDAKSSKRIGVAKGLFTVPDEFADWDHEIEKMFEERI